MTELSITDPLTGIANRRGYFKPAAQKLGQLESSQGCMVGMADLDHFKPLNDTHGHDVGDRALKVFAETLSTTSGEQGLVGRLGGDEFAFVVVDQAPTLERVRAQLSERCQSLSLGEGLSVQASLGIVTADPAECIDDVLGRADQALYELKHSRGTARIA